MKRIFAVAMLILLLLSITVSAESSAELYLNEQSRPIFDPTVSEVMRLFREGDKQGAFDLAVGKYEDLNAEILLEAWDGALCHSSQEELALYGALMPDADLSDTYSEYPGILYCIGFLMVDDKQYENALDYLETAHTMNPVGIMIAKELINCRITAQDLEGARALLSEVQALCILPEDFGWYYRRLGYILCEEGDYALSWDCQLYSLVFEDSDIAYNELEYLDNVMGYEAYDYRGNAEAREEWTYEAAQAIDEAGLGFGIQEAQVAVLNELADMYADTDITVYADAVAFFESMDDRLSVL